LAQITFGVMFDLKDRIDAAAKIAGWTAAAATAAVVAFLFLCLALFVWLRHTYGAVIASLVLAGVFALVALAAVVAARLSRQLSQVRQERRKEHQSPSISAQWLTDPVVLTVALQLVRVLGARRAAVPLVLGGVLGTMISHPSRRKQTNAHRHDAAG
jgi:hypothetical protein